MTLTDALDYMARRAQRYSVSAHEAEEAALDCARLAAGAHKELAEVYRDHAIKHARRAADQRKFMMAQAIIQAALESQLSKETNHAPSR